MSRPLRRANDAQTERFLSALTQLEYRQSVARRLAGIKPTAKLPKQDFPRWRDYQSAMRRLQRYVTESGEKRSFAAAPAAKRKPVIAAARRVPLPTDYLPPARPLPPPAPEPKSRPSFFREIEPATFEKPAKREVEWDVDLFDLRAVSAYFDADNREAARALAEASRLRPDQQDRMERLLDLAQNGTDVLGLRQSGVLKDAVRDLMDQLPGADADDVETFAYLFREGEQADWKIEMILDDMKQGNTTFADWMDAYRDSGESLETDDNAYWELWREAYARAKK